MIPLKEILSEVVGVGSASKKVNTLYMKLIRKFGNELDILQRAPVEDLNKFSCHLGEGLSRMRDGQVIRKAGFDGEYGVISVFSEKERAQIKNGGTLVSMAKPDKHKDVGEAATPCSLSLRPEEEIRPIEFNKGQKKAIKAGPAPVLVLARSRHRQDANPHGAH